MKLLHCADIHLDSPLRGLSQHESAPVDQIRGATRRAFENLVEIAVEESVDAVVMAGDIYDGDRDDYNTAAFLQKQFERLRGHEIPVVLVHGNHDAANDITRRLKPPPNVHVFGFDAASTYLVEDAGIAFHGRSYGQRVVTEDISLDYPDPVPNMLNVGVLHTCLDGRPGHEPYAPCTESGLAAKGYEYWALGHVHERYESERQDTRIVFPGNVQGRNVRETGPKGASLVSYSGTDVTSVEHRVADVVRWARCDIDITGVDAVDDVLAMAALRLEEQVNEADGRLLAARVVIKGTAPVAATLQNTREAWGAQLRADAAGASDLVWIEKVQLTTSEPATSGDTSDAVDAIRSAFAKLAADDEAREALASKLTPLKTRLGSDLAQLTEIGMTSIDTDSIAELLPDIEATLLARLHGEVN